MPCYVRRSIMQTTLVIGHKNPDTDSICSAICYAELKRRVTGESYLACRAGEINNETQFVLDRFSAKQPKLITSLEPKLRHVYFRRIKGIDGDFSLRQAWEHMKNQSIRSVPILTPSNKVEGIVTIGDEAQFYMEDQDACALSKSAATYRNIALTLQGEILVGDGNERFSKGKVSVASGSPEMMGTHIKENDLVILGNRVEAQLCAIDLKVSCIVISLGAEVSPHVLRSAEEEGCTVIVSPLDSYTIAKLINQAVPVRHIMKTEGIISFSDDDLVSDVKEAVAKVKIRYFPVVDRDGCYLGMVSQRNLLTVGRQKVILVDHNEKGQAADGIRSAEVIEIIDHHRIDSVETMNPIYFRNQPLGCTSTIIAQMYREQGVDITPQIAGLLCSAIISDTLMFRSPTCTPVDERTARELAQIAGINIEEHATEMFNAGSCLSNKTADEIFHIDCKSFKANHYTFTVSQVTSVSGEELAKVRSRMLPFIREYVKQAEVDMLLMMLTNIIEESTELLFVGKNAKEIVSNAFSAECSDESVVLKGVVSRKKQIIAPIVSAIEAM